MVVALGGNGKGQTGPGSRVRAVREHKADERERQWQAGRRVPEDGGHGVV